MAFQRTRQRIADWLHECDIAALENDLTRAMANHDPEARWIQAQLRDAVAQRSPEQVARMERKRGLAH